MSELRQKSKIAIFINVIIYLAVIYVYLCSKLVLRLLESPVFVESVVFLPLGSHYVVYAIITPPVLLFGFLSFLLLYDWVNNFKAYKLHVHFFVLVALMLGSLLFYAQCTSHGISTYSFFASIYSIVMALFAFTMLMAPVSSALTGASPYKKDSLPKGIYALPVSYSWEKAEEGSLSMFDEELNTGGVSLSEDDGMLSIQEV